MADDVAEDEEYEEQAIKYLFYRGFEYEEMRGLLFEEFGIKMSLSTLKRRLKALNLARKQRMGRNWLQFSGATCRLKSCHFDSYAHASYGETIWRAEIVILKVFTNL